MQKHLHLGLLPSNVLQSDQYTNYLLKVVETRHSFFIVWRVIGTYKTFSMCVCVRASAQRLSGRSVFNARQIYGTQILCDYHRNSWNIGIWGHYQETRGLQQKQNTEQSLLLWKNLYILNSKILLHVFFCPIFLAQVTFPGSQSRKPEKT